MSGPAVHLTEAFASLHMALDSGELACACGTLIEDLLGSVRWRVRFGNSSNEDTDLFFGGTGATI
ncbi:MAG: hypothetical protein KAW17_05020, partial [Candidatus Eisenbacteria sp.]|nr:hypothetical protein [Candidatus Eisenbacteria bacterium]